MATLCVNGGPAVLSSSSLRGGVARAGAGRAGGSAAVARRAAAHAADDIGLCAASAMLLPGRRGVQRGGPGHVAGALPRAELAVGHLRLERWGAGRVPEVCCRLRDEDPALVAVWPRTGLQAKGAAFLLADLEGFQPRGRLHVGDVAQVAFHRALRARHRSAAARV